MSNETHDLDLGDGHWLDFTRWAPDDLPGNRERFGFPLPVVEKSGAMIGHKKPDGSDCWGHVYFDIPQVVSANLGDPTHRWQVSSWDPLTISPSILCKICGDHGFIRDGRWVRA